MTAEDLLLFATTGPLPLPPKPTRDQVCAIRNHFQGLLITTQQLGAQYWFEPQLADLTDPADRAIVYQAHRDVGDTHINLSLDLTGLDGLAWRKALIREAITTGGMTGVLLMCMGDGHGDPNTDPGALGHDWLMDHFGDIFNYMASEDGDDDDLTPWIIFCPGYDGVVPDWQPPSSVGAFLRHARSVMGPEGYLALELSAGYAVWTGERNDWDTDEGRCCDVILMEYPIDWGPPQPIPAQYLDGRNWKPDVPNDVRSGYDQIWQITGRLIQPYLRPADQPDNDDGGGAPYLLGGGTSRGPFYFIAYEHSTYSWVRQHCDVALVNERRTYLKSLGCALVG